MKPRVNVGVLLLVLFTALGAAARPAIGAPRQAAARPPTAASVTLRLSKSTANPGNTLTLTAVYSNLGLVNTTLTVSRPDAVQFTPAVPTPCRFDVHPDGCRTFPLQALLAGSVTFRASANGETYDEGCQCWRFVTVTSPVVTLFVNGPLPPRAYLPMVAAQPGVAPGGRMVFTSSRDVAYEIHRMRPDGTTIQRLTANTERDEAADVSPDGATIVFQSRRDDGVGLYLMNSDGGNQRRISAANAMDTIPVWSPDGRRIAFTSFRDGNAEIYVMDADGANVRRLTTADASYDTAPAWSPDGRTIAFNSDREVRAHYSIYLMDADGANLRRLTAGNDWWPVWAPDGQQIAFTALAGGAGALYRIRPDGTQRTQVTTAHNVTGKPVWSPAGDMLAFNADNQQSLTGIYVVDANGGALRAVLQPDAQNTINDWTP